MAHLDIHFPRDIAQGCQGLIERRDEIVQLASGREESNQRWVDSRRSWSGGLAIRKAADLAAVVEVFEEARGRANSFHFRDWLDHRSAPHGAPITASDQPIGQPAATGTLYEVGAGDGARREFQLVKRYGAANPYLRPIALPDPASLRVAVDGAETTAFALASPGGRITFDVAPPPGAVLTAGFEFDVPVRFETANLAVSWAYFRGQDGLGEVPDFTLIEVRLDGEAA
ncbi:uncharacterized protein (TIGR02217 family) [Roseovarius sp. MBR-154]|jgi:uncharacterized protein (TIGR02217 family)